MDNVQNCDSYKWLTDWLANWYLFIQSLVWLLTSYSRCGRKVSYKEFAANMEYHCFGKSTNNNTVMNRQNGRLSEKMFKPH
jgi:hypothetical protein